jgi:hypothetical protein
VLGGLVEEVSDVAVVEGVPDVAAAAARAHDAAGAEEGELVGDGGKGHSDGAREIADAGLAAAECGEDTDAGLLAEDAEDVREVPERGVGQAVSSGRHT